jgi:hypothetical protein
VTDCCFICKKATHWSINCRVPGGHTLFCKHLELLHGLGLPVFGERVLMLSLAWDNDCLGFRWTLDYKGFVDMWVGSGDEGSDR